MVQVSSRQRDERPQTTALWLAKIWRNGHVFWIMKYRLGIVLLALVGIGLGIGLIAVKREQNRLKEEDTRTILTLTNQLVDAKSKFEEQKKVSALLEEDLNKQKQSFGDLTNSFSQVSEN